MSKKEEINPNQKAKKIFAYLDNRFYLDKEYAKKHKDSIIARIGQLLR